MFVGESGAVAPLAHKCRTGPCHTGYHRGGPHTASSGGCSPQLQWWAPQWWECDTGPGGSRPPSVTHRWCAAFLSSLHLVFLPFLEQGSAYTSPLGGGGWHEASVSDCLPLAAPIGLSPLLILTIRGPERVLVVSTEPPDDLSCLTTPGVGRPGDGAVARAVDQGHPEAPPESMRGFVDSSTDLRALGCASAGGGSLQRRQKMGFPKDPPLLWGKESAAAVPNEYAALGHRGPLVRAAYLVELHRHQCGGPAEVHLRPVGLQVAGLVGIGERQLRQPHLQMADGPETRRARWGPCIPRHQPPSRVMAQEMTEECDAQRRH